MQNFTLRRPSSRGQAGFTMVELAIVLVIAGIILVAALKGTDMINKAKIERVVQDIRGIQTMVFEHEKRTGRLAGDCNGSGIIGDGEALLTALQKVRLGGADYSDANALATVGAGATAPCISSATSEDVIDRPWNDLRKASIIDPNRPNRQVTKNQTNNFYAIGSWEITPAGGTAVETNVIVAYDLPLWMAKGVDVAIDGSVTLTNPAKGGSTGRVRLLGCDGGPPVTNKNGQDWPTDAEDSKLCSIFFIFDRYTGNP
jgi:prepilin-type N-terminal cleavage/methylation domain-containing protein